MRDFQHICNVLKRCYISVGINTHKWNVIKHIDSFHVRGAISDALDNTALSHSYVNVHKCFLVQNTLKKPVQFKVMREWLEDQKIEHRHVSNEHRTASYIHDTEAVIAQLYSLHTVEQLSSAGEFI